MQNLLNKITNKTAKVLVIGGGYVGLPLAARCAEEGFETIIYDIDEKKVEDINKGVSYIKDIPSDMLSSLIQTQKRVVWAPGKIKAIWTLEELIPLGEGIIDPIKPDIILICVPTPLNKRHDPDVSFVMEAVKKLADEWILEDSQLVVLESTVYPGFTREVMLPAIDQYSLSSPFVAFSPERVDPGNEKFDIKNTPKVVGGVNEDSTKLAVAFYSKIIDKVVEVSSAETAEMTKIYENTFRMINIGLANEIALICDKLGIDVWEMTEAAATKPFGFMKFIPGPGIGGHCISVDPHYLSWKLKDLQCHSKFIELAEEINVAMPKRVVALATEALNSIKKSINGSRILVIGAAYKSNIGDLRESPALDIIETLKQKGAEVSYYDPYAPQIKFDDGIMRSLPAIVGNFDCAIIATDHSCIDYREVLACSQLVVDTRNALKNIENKNNTPVFKL
jgi:UDP-N-acetyl-D-glucosamine dehydrogenase